MPASPTPTPRVDLEELVAEGRRLYEMQREPTGLGWAKRHLDFSAWLHNNAADLLEAVEYAGRLRKGIEEAMRISRGVVPGHYDRNDYLDLLDHIDRTLIAALARPHPDEEAGRCS